MKEDYNAEIKAVAAMRELNEFFESEEFRVLLTSAIIMDAIRFMSEKLEDEPEK